MRRAIDAIAKWVREQIEAGKTAGWLLIFFGLLLAPNLIGISMVVVGIVLLNRKRNHQPLNHTHME
jgi:hypothetical protein